MRTVRRISVDCGIRSQWSSDYDPIIYDRLEVALVQSVATDSVGTSRNSKNLLNNLLELLMILVDFY